MWFDSFMSEAMKESLEDLGKSPAGQRKKKLDRVLEVLGLTNIRCNRMYDTDIMKLIMSSAEKGECPELLAVRTWNEKRGEEVQLIYLGEHHVEDLTYFKTNPKSWNTKRFGYMVLTPTEAVKLREILEKVKTEFEPLFPTGSIHFYCWAIS